MPKEHEGKASGANNTIRELGRVFGVAVLAAIFSASGSYATARSYVDGVIPAVAAGAIVVALSALVALALPGLAKAQPAADPASASALPGRRTAELTA